MTTLAVVNQKGGVGKTTVALGLAAVAARRDLSVVVFRRLGWEPADYAAWSDRMLAEEFAFVVPTSHDGETLARFAIVNPETSEDDITAILDTMD